MFHNQRKRLLRKENWTANDLAQELWAMFGPDVPLEHRGPITLYQDGEQPAIVLKNYGDGDNVFRVDRGNSVVNIPINGGSLGSPSVGGGVSGEAARSAFMGFVISGSGSAYTVRLDTGVNVTVSVPQIASGQSFPSGTYAVVILGEDGVYRFQPAVWQ